MFAIIKSRYKVRHVYEKKHTVYVSGVGANAVTREESSGWWIVLENYLAINIGKEKPDLKAGDTIQLSIGKVTT